MALAGVYRHLRPGGTFICTLHNPTVRRRSVDGRRRLIGRYPLAAGTLLVWSASRQSADSGVVQGIQTYEEYDADGLLARQRTLDMRFALIEREDFAERATQAGFRVDQLYGDYDRSPFAADTSPFMIWLLRR
jgi:hypothetical protein